MYHVLLVDDEESVLHVLRTSIDWQELGIENLLTASDGLAARIFSTTPWSCSVRAATRMMIRILLN